MLVARSWAVNGGVGGAGYFKQAQISALDFALRCFAAAIVAFCCLVSRKAKNIWLSSQTKYRVDSCCIQTLLHLTAMLRHSPEQPKVSNFANVILCLWWPSNTVVVGLIVSFSSTTYPDLYSGLRKQGYCSLRQHECNHCDHTNILDSWYNVSWEQCMYVFRGIEAEMLTLAVSLDPKIFVTEMMCN